MRVLLLALAAAGLVLAGLPPAEYARRVAAVTGTRGFVALWDFVRRDPADGRFEAWKAKGETADLRLDAVNYVRDYWGEGRAATYADFPLLPEGPFGQAVEFHTEADPSFRPLLLVPRARLHGSGLDAKGPRRGVTLLVWLRRTPASGNHAIAGIWHEGTDLAERGPAARRVEAGRRQYALFGGLAAHPLAAASHVSENGGASFGDKYARHLSVTAETIPAGPWTSVALVFDNAHNTVTSYVDGRAGEYWIEDPARQPFFQWAAKAWERGEYRPPRAFVRTRDGALTALRVNPYWFPHDLYSPPDAASGGPFTIGRVIHSGRNGTAPGVIGGVAVFDRPLSPKTLRRLAALGR